MGLKCVAIYRDFRALAAPNTKRTNEGGDKADPAAATNRISELEVEIAKLRVQAGQPLRRRLPETRTAITHKFDIAGHEGYLTVGLFEDAQPGELFITMAKEGSTIGGLMDSIGTLTSMALQYGVPLEALGKKFAHQRLNHPVSLKIRKSEYLINHRLRFSMDGFAIYTGYREELDSHQPELAIPGLLEEVKKINRPVPEPI
jgi:ribonucleoside-diphosphate reductase alpha chain